MSRGTRYEIRDAGRSTRTRLKSGYRAGLAQIGAIAWASLMATEPEGLRGICARVSPLSGPQRFTNQRQA